VLTSTGLAQPPASYSKDACVIQSISKIYFVFLKEIIHKMISKTKQEMMAEQLNKVWVNLSKLNEETIEITYTVRVLGGNGMTLRYPSEQDANKVLLAFGIKEALIKARLNSLREARPGELVEVGEFDIPGNIRLANGFTV